MSARDDILARVRAAIAAPQSNELLPAGERSGTPTGEPERDGRPYPEPAAAEAQAHSTAVPRNYREAGALAPGSAEVIALLEDRLVDYKAHVHRARGDAEIAAVVAEIVRESRERAGSGASGGSGNAAGSAGAMPAHDARPEGDAAARAAAHDTVDPGEAADGQATGGLAEPGASAQPAPVLVVPSGLDSAWLTALPADIEIRADSRDAPLSAQALDGTIGVVTASRVAIAETGTIVLDGEADQGRRAISLVPDLHVCVVRAAQVVEIVPEGVRRLAEHPERPQTWISGPSATSDIELERVEGVHGPRQLHVVLAD